MREPLHLKSEHLATQKFIQTVFIMIFVSVTLFKLQFISLLVQTFQKVIDILKEKS